MFVVVARKVADKRGAKSGGIDADGAILVFVPGWEDISKLRDSLARSPAFSDARKYLLLPLHSMVTRPAL